jgi:stromal membrane-associated protein
MAKQVVSEDEQERVFRILLAEQENGRCAECFCPGPRWASVNLGVFLCIQCSGFHRKLGVHVSQVRSINLDRWTSEQLENMKRIGNRRAAAIWEAQLPTDFERPSPGDIGRMQQFIWNKYVEKLYYREPSQYFENEGHSVSRDASAATASTVSPAVTLQNSRQSSMGACERSKHVPVENNSFNALFAPSSERGNSHEHAHGPVAGAENHEHLQRKRHILAMYAQRNNSEASSDRLDTSPKT